MKYLFHEVRKTRPSLAHPLFAHSTLCTHATPPSAHRRRLFDPLPFSSLPPPSHHTHTTHASPRRCARRSSLSRRTLPHLTYLITHLSPQVRTPLNSLTMGIDMLKLSDTIKEDEREYLDMMQVRPSPL